MPMEVSHIWLGQFSREVLDYFEEHYRDRGDDDPLSQFAGEQGETWYDHDWVEISCLYELQSVRSLVDGHSYSASYLDLVLAKAAELGITEVNVFILADKGEFSRPRSVSGTGYRLWYLGEFTCDI
jgi:hypothetical protein